MKRGVLNRVFLELHSRSCLVWMGLVLAIVFIVFGTEMIHPQGSNPEIKVWETIQALNKTWTQEGHPEKLREYFHPEIVVITPADSLRLEGREACAASWEAFTRAATIHKWEVHHPKIQVYGKGKFAVVTYYYEMMYDINGKTRTAAGRDMFVMVNEGERWWAIADQFSPYPGP